VWSAVVVARCLIQYCYPTTAAASSDTSVPSTMVDTAAPSPSVPSIVPLCIPSLPGMPSTLLSVQDECQSLPRRNHKNEAPLLTSKPVKVFILMGQSNMIGMGTVNGSYHDGTLEFAVQSKKRFQHLVDESSGQWTTATNVRNVRVMRVNTSDMEVLKNEWLTVDNKKEMKQEDKFKYVGPDLQIGFVLRHALGEDQPILLIKSATGNRALGWDLLPPGSMPAIKIHSTNGKLAPNPDSVPLAGMLANNTMTIRKW
jgi:hypothetical protein